MVPLMFIHLLHIKSCTQQERTRTRVPSNMRSSFARASSPSRRPVCVFTHSYL